MTLFLRSITAAVATIVAIAPATAIVGPSEEDAAIVGQTVMVLNRQGPAAGFCSAVVVAADAVLTAAHCASPGAALKVFYRQDGAPVLRDVAAVERNPGFKPDAIVTRQRSIDLALVRLAAPLPTRFSAATLSDGGAATVGSPYRLAGYGLQREAMPGSSGMLRIARVVAQAPLSGILLWARDPTGRGSGACTGDSGGPVLAPDGTVVGLIAWSAGAGKARCGTLTQAVWLGPQRAWIAAVLSRWARQPAAPPP